MAPKKKDGDQLVQKSPAEFFADNKNIAGFDNVRSASVCCAVRAVCVRVVSLRI
jgi:DNA topoisomerase VI subunit B